MITELRVENFKSFGSDMSPLFLRPLNFVVGANASGKTNLLSSLRFLKIALLQNVEIAVGEFDGPGEVRNKILRERKETKPVRMRLKVDGAKLGEFLEGWSFFNISPAVARQPCKEVPELALGEAGEYLAAILHKLEKQNGEKGSLEQIVAGLRGAVPGFKNVRAKALEVEGKWTFQVVEDRIRGAINPRSVSDGTIRLLAMLVIAHWSARCSTLLAIEEPENGLHPHLSKHIVELLRTASETRQVIATTHNSSFLDELEPEEVILCDKKEGFTVVHHASEVAEIKSFRKHFRLGELWEQGTLGGIP